MKTWPAHTGGGIQATQSGSFTYEATNDEIIFSEGTPDEFTWERNEDKSDEQVFEFVENVSGTDYTVVLTFTK